MILFILIQTSIAEILNLTDHNFQKVTLISKHIPQYEWVVAFCYNECSAETKIKLNNLQNEKKAYVDLAKNQWIAEGFKEGLYQFFTNDTFCDINNCKLQPIPQRLHFFKQNFTDSRLFVVHIGLVIIVIFYFVAYKLIKDFRNEKQKED
ncbi:hypothetical protein pb186bvf_008217 [Paramecium bursaria]